MNCNKYQEQIAELFGGNQLPDELKTHLESCQICREFYESQGYEVYGELDSRPAAPILYHMKKRL